MHGWRTLGLILVLFGLPVSALAQENDATRTLDAYFRGLDGPAVAAAENWVEQGGGALAWYYLGRIHLRHRRSAAALDAFRAGLKALDGEEGRSSRPLTARLRRMVRVASLVAGKEAGVAPLRHRLAETAAAAGRSLLAAGWETEAVSYLGLARSLGTGESDAGQDRALLARVDLEARLRSPGWEELIPSPAGAWRRLDLVRLEEEPGVPEPPGTLLALSPNRPAVVHDAPLPTLDAVAFQFRAETGDGRRAGRLGVILRYRSPHDYRVVFFGPEQAQLVRWVVEHGERSGQWHSLGEVRHDCVFAPGAWHRLYILAKGDAGGLSLFSDGRLVAEFTEGAPLLDGRIGFLAEGVPVSVRGVKVRHR